MKGDKCSTLFCRKRVQHERGMVCDKCRKRIWRERHPLAAKFADHVRNARVRGIPVLWTREEFSMWCVLTGYHLLDDHEIHRIGDTGPYSFDNCRCITKHENASLGGKKKWMLHRMKMLETNAIVGLA